MEGNETPAKRARPDDATTFTDAFAFTTRLAHYQSAAAAAAAMAESEAAAAGADTPLRTAAAAAAATAAAGPAPAATFAIGVNRRQRANPVLRYIRNVPWQIEEVLPDFVLGEGACALFLSLRYHLQHPDYLLRRIRELRQSYRVRMVLCLVDMEDSVAPLEAVTRIAFHNDFTVVCAWSNAEAGRYLETFKAYEKKSAAAIQERVHPDYMSQVTDCLITVRAVTKPNAATLVSAFGSLRSLLQASPEELSLCPGMGTRKSQRLHDVLHAPFA